MAREPSYPNDAPIGAKPPEAPETSAPTPAAAPPSATAATDNKRKKQLVKGAAIGIGSAAIVAALLYANKGRKGGDKA